MKVDVAKAAAGQLRDVRSLDEPTEGVAGPKANIVENDVKDVRRPGRCRIRNWKGRLRHIPGPTYLSRKDLPFMVGFQSSPPHEAVGSDAKSSSRLQRAANARRWRLPLSRACMSLTLWSPSPTEDTDPAR